MRLKALICTLATMFGAACAALPVAQMALPEPLAALEPLPLKGLKAARSGEFDLAGVSGRFERSASRLSLFETVDFDRVGASYTLAPGGDAAVSTACRARQTSGSLGWLSGAPRPYEVRCEFNGAFSGQLTLTAGSVTSGSFGTQAERSGRLSGGGVTLELRSVHRVKGSPLPLEVPIGYVFSEGGRPVGAVELNGTTPRIWRPAAGTPQHDAVTHAALVLSLLWDPAGR